MTEAQELDPIMARIGTAIEAGQQGDGDRAVTLFDEIWAEVGADGDAFYRVVTAHYAADVQAEPSDSLTWNLRALAAAEGLTDASAQRHHASLQVEAFYPSLHLNLARDYLDLEQKAEARKHIAAANARVTLLPDDGYGRMVRSGIARIEAELAGESPAPHGTSCQH